MFCVHTVYCYQKISAKNVKKILHIVAHRDLITETGEIKKIAQSHIVNTQ